MTKSKSIAFILALAGLHGQVYADQLRLTYMLNQTIPHNPWKETTPFYTDWKETSTPYSCSNWSPSPSTIGKGISFTQTADDCQQEEKRTVRPRQVDDQGNTQYTPGASFDQIRYVTVTHSREALGIVENWLAHEPILGNWIDTNKLYGCTQWTPSPDAYATTVSFNQTSSNCSTDQERDRQEREQESNTHDIRNAGDSTVDKQTLRNQKASRSYTVDISPWSNVDSIRDCSNWSPARETVSIGVDFTQSATDCKQDQQRTRSESYTDHRSGVLTPVSAVRQEQTLDNQKGTQTATGTAQNPSVKVTAPSLVFAQAPFDLSWSSTNAAQSTLRTSSSNSGAPASDTDVTGKNTWSITPVVAGTYDYTVNATNTAGVMTSDTQRVIAESDPTYSALSVNNLQSINVSPNAALSFKGASLSSGAVLQGRNAANSDDQSLPSNAPSSAGTSTYYSAAKKQLNGVTRYSGLRSVAVTVVNDPTVATNAPTNVFADAPFTLSWTGTNASKYVIQGSADASGLPMAGKDVGTSASAQVTPSAAGTFSYAVVATNAAGVAKSGSSSVSVEANPTIAGLTANGAPSISVSPGAPLKFAGSSMSPGSSLVGRNGANTESAALPSVAASSAGVTTYYAAASKTINGITRNSSIQSVAVTVVGAPTISSFAIPAKAYVGWNTAFSWEGTNASSYSIRADKPGSGFSTTDTTVGAAKSIAVNPTLEGTYDLTLTATNSVGVSTSLTQKITINEPSAEGTYALSTPSGQNTAVQITNGRAFNMTSTGLSKGIVQQVGISIGNYVNKANGLVTLDACTPSACTTASLNMAGTIDNSMMPFVFANPLPIGKGESMSMTFTGSGSTYPAAIWTYQGRAGGMGGATTIGTTNGYANMTITYKSGQN